MECRSGSAIGLAPGMGQQSIGFAHRGGADLARLGLGLGQDRPPPVLPVRGLLPIGLEGLVGLEGTIGPAGRRRAVWRATALPDTGGPDGHLAADAERLGLDDIRQ